MKNVKLLIASLTISIVISQTAKAQLIAENNLAAFASVPGHKPVELEKETKVVIEKPNVTIVTKLTHLFPQAKDQKWTMIDNHYHAFFTNNGQKSRAVFTKEGKLNYAIMECSLEQLPMFLQKKLKKDYAAYTLVQASEINAYNTKAHQVILENEAGYITLRATQGNVEQVDAKKKIK